MNTPKQAKKVANRCPDTFNTIRVNLANTIAIIIYGTLTIFMTDHGMLPIKSVIPTPTICQDDGIRTGELMHMIRQRLFICVTNHTQSHTTLLATERPNHRGTIIGIGAVAFAFVPAPTGRVLRVSMAITFLTSVLEHLIGLDLLIRQR